MRIRCYLVTPLLTLPYCFNSNPRHLHLVLHRFKEKRLRRTLTIMAATIFKSLKKKGDGRSSLNRQNSVQIPAENSVPKAPKYQNSYRLDPYKSFNFEPVDKIVKQVMINNLEDIVYDAKECPKLCAEISVDIRNRICKQNFDRCKIVVIVTINEKCSQGVHTSMQFIWDVQRDNYSSFTFETRTFFAYCCVLGVYCE